MLNIDNIKQSIIDANRDYGFDQPNSLLTSEKKKVGLIHRPVFIEYWYSSSYDDSVDDFSIYKTLIKPLIDDYNPATLNPTTGHLEKSRSKDAVSTFYRILSTTRNVNSNKTVDRRVIYEWCEKQANSNDLPKYIETLSSNIRIVLRNHCVCNGIIEQSSIDGYSSKVLSKVRECTENDERTKIIELDKLMLSSNSAFLKLAVLSIVALIPTDAPDKETTKVDLFFVALNKVIRNYCPEQPQPNKINDHGFMSFKNELEHREYGIYKSLRKKEIASALNSINSNSSSTTVIYGNGGLGKTSTALWLYNYLSSNYDRCGWVSYNESLDESLLSSITFSDSVERDKDERLRLIKDYLFSDTEQRTLIVIDNASIDVFKNEGYIRLIDLSKCPNTSIVITTRAEKDNGFENDNNYGLEHIVWIPIAELDLKRACRLFKHYYGFSEIAQEDEGTIRKIVEKVGRNSLLVEITAKIATQIQNEKDILLSDFVDMVFGENTLPKPGLKVVVKTNYTSPKTVDNILMNLYSISNFTDEEREIVWGFAILPNMFIKKRILHDVFQLDHTEQIVDKLHKSGWLRQVPGYGYQMHDLIKSMLWNYRKSDECYITEPDLYAFCSKYNNNGYAPGYAFRNVVASNWKDVAECPWLASSPQWSFVFDYDDESADIIYDKTKVLEACVERLMIPDDSYCELVNVLANKLYRELGFKSDSEKYYRIAIDCYIKKYSCNPLILSELFLDYASLLSSFDSTRYSEAIDWLKAALLCIKIDNYDNSHNSDEICLSCLNYDLSVYVFNKHREKIISIGLECVGYENQNVIAVVNELFVRRGCDINYVESFYSISSIIRYCKILTLLGSIITIYDLKRYDLAEKLLGLAYEIGSYLYSIATLNYCTEAEIREIIDPFFIDRIEEYCPPEYLYEYLTNEYPIIDPYVLEDISEKYDDGGLPLPSWFIQSFEDETLGKLNWNGIVSSFEHGFSARFKSEEVMHLTCAYLFATTEDNLCYLFSHLELTDYKPILEKLTHALNLHRWLSRERERLKEMMSRSFSDALDGILLLYYMRSKLIYILKEQSQRSEISWTLTNIAELETDIGGKEMLDLATEHYLEAIQIREELCNKTKGRYRDNKAWSCLGIARCYAKLDDEDNSRKYYDEAVALYTELAQENQEYIPDLEYVLSLTNLKDTKLPVGNQSHFSRKAIEKGKSL